MPPSVGSNGSFGPTSKPRWHERSNQRRNRIDIQESLAEILSRLAVFLGPVLVQTPTACDPNCQWEVGGHWVTQGTLRQVD